MSTVTDSAATAQEKRLSLLRVLGPVHVWALGVGIVLVGEYMGWNFSIGGGMIAGLVAAWVAGLLYTSVAMIDSRSPRRWRRRVARMPRPSTSSDR